MLINVYINYTFYLFFFFHDERKKNEIKNRREYNFQRKKKRLYRTKTTYVCNE